MSRLERAFIAFGLVALLMVGVAVVSLLLGGGDEEQQPPLALPSEIVGPDPLAFESGRTATCERAAAFGLSHALFAKSPRGVMASVRRTASVRPRFGGLGAPHSRDLQNTTAAIP